MRHAWIGVLTVFLLAMSVAFSSVDVTQPTPPQQVSLNVGGLLGYRYQMNWQNRLMTLDENTLLDPFRNRPGSQAWIGEHVGKWLHAATLTWVSTQNPDLRTKIDRVVSELIATQESDGYLGTYDLSHRWSTQNPYNWDVWVHKYVLIGLLTYYQHTGNPAALTAARRAADLILNTFGTGGGQLDLMERSTHTGFASFSILQPMVWLYRETGDARYLVFCRYILWADENSPHGPSLISSLLSHRHVNEIGNAKAYEMLSCLVGTLELYRALMEEGQTVEAAPLLIAAQRAWEDIVANRLYLTGGCSWDEHFREDHFAENATLPAETCVSVTLLQLTLELFYLTGEARYMDLAERITFNHLLAAQHPDGSQWCYFTPLEGRKPYQPGIRCCMSSGPRAIALLPTFIYTQDDQGRLWVNLYTASEFNSTDRRLRVVQTTSYPYGNAVTLQMIRVPTTEWTLRLRIPDWCSKVRVFLNGSRIANLVNQNGTYYEIRRVWRRGDRVRLVFRMPLRMILGTGANEGKIALMRGPLVLAVDERFLPAEVRHAKVATILTEDLASLPFTPILLGSDGLWSGETAWDTSGKVHAVGESLLEFSLRLTDFAHTGATGKRYAIWLPRPTAPPVQVSLFSFERERRSRSGDVQGNLCDDSPYTWRVTRDSTYRTEDWFAVERDTPVTVERIVYIHGYSYRDGGWFDASVGKPRLQIKRTTTSSWEDLAVLENYPNTTATDRMGLQGGERFELILPEPVSCVGIRIIGKPATGRNPNQSFTSCAELQAFQE